MASPPVGMRHTNGHRLGGGSTTGGSMTGGGGLTTGRTFRPADAQPNAPLGTRRFGSAPGGLNTGERRFGAGSERRAFGAAPQRVVGGRSYEYRGRTFSAFHAAAYRWPHGYRYERFAVGHTLPRRFWVRDYYLDNYALYDLDPPPPDFEWVRYGPDILLVDLNTGAIAQVVYGAFDDADDAPMDGDQ